MSDEVTKIKARQRNLQLKMVRQYVAEQFQLNDKFTEDQIIMKFYFRQSDLTSSLKHFFEKKGDRYTFKKGIRDKIFSISNIHNTLKNEPSSDELVNDYLENFKSFSEQYLNNIFDGSNIYDDFYKKYQSSFEKLHWISLPEYEENMMINSSLLPEDNIEQYYNHYHTLEDLYNVLNGTLKPDNSFKGDINLNNRLSFRVYSRRWGHEDTYTIQRRIDGWHVQHLSINGLSDKDGSGPLLMNLDHDSIQYPKEGIKYALNVLWNLADETAMSVEELQIKLQEIALWISSVERVVGDYQPDWCSYY
ncbi:MULTISPECIES: hypothetical protein [unclassified Paenibacillus]|uniref:hypothetical protein n=1 Tax=unclassified Paenibacillus TaxID=185978 RepID=UPI000CFE0984|nr:MULTISPECIES: hypothetical protein [unclassified Paenibacillus]PRA00609.1 hypothetical protein CQ043_25850 [Paenibacillus sp. MYb63]PRA49855.1 hypothetical protein CQ061_05255 [Paenibacillus sp. MYb67]QZN75735.1 hypothetical protein K5K90_31115 [Paenibacillus sp. DR312]